MSYFTSKDETPACRQLEKKRYDTARRKDDMQLLSHGAECKMANVFRVSHILQVISQNFRRVK